MSSQRGMGDPQPLPKMAGSKAGRAPKAPAPQPELPLRVEEFRVKARTQGAAHGRDLPWRRTRDPYRIWISEVMLQQTQVARVEQRWDAWLAEFPTTRALARASDAEVLQAWQGMGYNRRALSLHRAAQMVMDEFGGAFPRQTADLLRLPGVGPSTAAGIRAFAFDLPGVYLETNVRAVFIHEFFPTTASVPDAALIPLVEAACPPSDVRGWYYALLDWGAWLKRAEPNPTRRAKAYARQSRFEGSHRQRRAMALRCVLGASEGVAAREVARALDDAQVKAGREPVGEAGALALLRELAHEGFCREMGGVWYAGADPDGHASAARENG